MRGPGQRKLIIFVHGVLGDMDNTWINPTTHNSWPDLIASDPEMKDFDLYVYGYSSPMVGEASNIREIADSFGQQLKDGKIFANYDEVDFITHSMGGIITKRMLDTLGDSAGVVAKIMALRMCKFRAVPHLINFYGVTPPPLKI